MGIWALYNPKLPKWPLIGLSDLAGGLLFLFLSAAVAVFVFVFKFPVSCFLFAVPVCCLFLFSILDIGNYIAC